MTGIKTLFMEVWSGIRRRPIDPGPVTGHPAIQEDDIQFIAREHYRRKWDDVIYVGPGADEANARRAQSLGIDIPQEKTTVKVKSSHMTQRAKLEERLNTLRAMLAGKKR